MKSQKKNIVSQPKEGFTVRINKLYRITGTVLAKDKTKHSVTILTEDGVVNVKVWNNPICKI